MASATSSPTASQSRRPSRHVSSPWTEIVRGESEPTIAAAAAAQSKPLIETIASPPPPASSSSSSVLTVEAGAGDEKSEGKKPVWKRPSNGASSEVGGPVMGASSWPALSEATTKAPSNKSSDSLKTLPDATSSLSQGIANASLPAPNRANPNPMPNHSRQRSFKRNGASGTVPNGTVSQPPAQGSLSEGHNPSPRGQNHRNGFVSQTHGGGGGGGTDNHLSQRDSFRNGNHHQSHGGRRNQEHWNFHRSFNGREGNAQSQRGGAPAFVRHPPPPVQQPIPPPFMAAQPFAGPVPFPPELASPFFPRMPFIAPLSPAPPVFYHVQDPPLNIKLQKQIHFYFSEENLIKDTYLRRHMDDQGFVPLPLIAGFNKVAELTDSIQQIVEALQGSPVVEVQGDRIRKRYNWQHWLLPKDPSSQSVGAVASRVGNLAIGESSADPIGGSSSQLQPVEAEKEAVSDGQQQSSGVVDPVSNRNDADGAKR